MNNSDKSKKQLLKEIEFLSTKIGKLEKTKIDHKLAEKTLHESEEKFRILYESSRDAIMMLAPPTWLFTAGNQATIKMFHAKNEKEFISKEPWELSPEYQSDGQLSSDKAKKMIQKAMKTGSNFFEWTHNRINGEDFPATVLLTRIKLKDKQLLQATVRDITKRKRIDEELYKHKHQLEVLVDERTKELNKEKEYYHSFVTSLNDWVWEMDIDGIHTYSNPAIESILGYKAEDIIGHHVSELWLDNSKTPKYLDSLKNVLASGKGWKNFSGRFKHKNGSLVITESSATPIYNSENKLIGYRGLDHDITKRKKAENELKKAKDFSENLLETANSIIITLDTKANITTFNKCAEDLSGYAKEEVLGKNWFDIFISPDDDKNISKVFNKVLESMPDVSQNENSIITKDGKERVINWNNNVIHDKYGNISGSLSIGVDVTDRKKVEEELRAGRERLNMLNKIIRHDLSNDFMVIKSAINLYKRSAEENMIDEIEGRVIKSLKTIENYRKYETFISSNVDLDEMEITEMINRIVPDFPKIKFKVDGNCKAFADEALFAVFTNLISNSIKHGKATKVDIKITSENNMCEIRFMDNGKGIPDKIKHKIFNEGFSYGKSGHTGIGLHLVKETIDRYGGYIYVEDNKPRGAVFVISLRKVLKHNPRK